MKVLHIKVSGLCHSCVDAFPKFSYSYLNSIRDDIIFCKGTYFPIGNHIFCTFWPKIICHHKGNPKIDTLLNFWVLTMICCERKANVSKEEIALL